ncbi:N-acetyltransferase GCN5 [Klebsiella aerogenes]|nr:N-acetyltransferase GCN5 [Klebsiella aerogenes]
MSITIRQATPDDATAIYDMIYELAVYEKAPEEVVTTPEEIRETLFASGSKTEALICEVAGKAVGYAVFFTSYSTWLGRNGIYMEDLYVTPDYRGDRRRKSAAENHRAICCTTSVRASGVERARLEPAGD